MSREESDDGGNTADASASGNAEETPLRDNRKENGHLKDSEKVEHDEGMSDHARHSSVVAPGQGRPSNPVVVLIDDEEATSLIDDEDEDNKQAEESSIPQDQTVKNETVEVDTTSKQTSLSNQTSFARSRKRRRNVARVADDAQDRPLLPPNQYETMLRRRAICKPEGEEDINIEASPTPSVKSLFLSASRNEDDQEDSSDNDEIEGYDEEYGDISVGMKLNIIGGKVIVQRINTLSDGRASPAELTGLIQRGDVLLSIDNVSLVNLPLDQLLIALKPLSDPHTGKRYKRSLHLRFAAGEGLKLLEKNESMQAPSADPTFALSQYVTFVDQLSGMPMFEPEMLPTKESDVVEPVVAKAVKVVETPFATKGMSSNELISLDIADYRKMEQKRYISEYFMWNDDFSKILRSSAMLLSHEYADGRIPLTFSEMVESGERAMVGAKALFLNMEDVDKGKDTRSFKKWNSTLSLRSRANARRRYVMKNVIQHEAPLEEEEPSDLESMGSSTSGDADEPTGDELLLQLAAHDEIWRHNVIEVLRNAAKEIEEGESKLQGSQASGETDDGSNGAPQSLESLLFGSKVSTMLTSKKQSHALPPEDVTSVLFDLMTNLTVTPDEISLNDSNHHVRLKSAAMIPFRERHSRRNENALFAAQFLVSDALPVWLKSFKPLPWEQRGILWPKVRSASGTSLASASYDISIDDLTQNSGSTGHMSPGRKYRKGLRQQIEDLELNEESRAETCILVTFYFTEELLPSIAASDDDGTVASSRINDAVEFVNMYGAYLRLHSCLVCAAMLKAEDVIEALLALSKRDPRHREVTKELSKSNTLLLYEPTMLSAIISRLNGVQKESESDRRRDMMNICVSAYPDLLPWQVRKACLGNDAKNAVSSELHKMYYEYLSLLLHPWEGHEAARQDAELVTEWCKLSLESSVEAENEAKSEEKRSNFYCVASRSSSDHRSYRRDLFSLMNLSVRCDERDLALDLVDEMLDSSLYYSDKAVLSATLEVLRNMAKGALNIDASLDIDMDDLLLRKVFVLFEKMAAGKSTACRDSIDVSHELYSLLQSCQNDDPGPSEAELAFVNLLAHQGAPVYALQTLALWAPSYSSSAYMIPLLHTLLQRGSRNGITREISGTLLRIRHARGESRGRQLDESESSTASAVDANVWRRMFDGSVAIAK